LVEGYWLVRERLGFNKWGPPLPAAIMRVHTTVEPGQPTNRMERSPFLAAFVGGEPVSIYSLQQETHTYGNRIYRREREISESDYRFRLADLEWSKQHAPHEPQARPREALNLLQATLPF
jgi:hypothetical protein